MVNPKRSRDSTMKRVGIALEQLVIQKGLQELTMDALASKAHVSKVLLYRYFGNLAGVVEFGLKEGYLLPYFKPINLALLQPVLSKDASKVWTQYLLQFCRHLRASPSSRDIIKQTFQKNKVSKVIYDGVHTKLSATLDQLDFSRSVDQPALTALLFGGLLHLTVQAHLDRPVLGIDLRSEEGWQRIERAINLLSKAFYTTQSL